MARLATFLVNLLLAAALVAAAAAVLFVFSGPDDRSAAFILGYKPLVVLSGSMEPTLMTDSIVLVRSIPCDEVCEGDVVSISRGDGFVTHRVVGRVDGGLVTKGDANPAVDPGLVAADDHVAVVVGVYNGVAPWVHAIRTGDGFFSLIVAPSLSLAAVVVALWLLVPMRRSGRFISPD